MGDRALRLREEWGGTALDSAKKIQEQGMAKETDQLRMEKEMLLMREREAEGVH